MRMKQLSKALTFARKDNISIDKILDEVWNAMIDYKRSQVFQILLLVFKFNGISIGKLSPCVDIRIESESIFVFMSE